MSKPALIFFFTARVHTTKSTVKILAANTHCKYFFFKLQKLLIFSVRGTACTRGLYNPLYRLMSRPLQHSPRLSQPVLRVALLPALWGVDISTDRSDELQLLAFASTVTLGFGFRRNPWLYFCFFPEHLHSLKWASLFRQEEGSDYYYHLYSGSRGLR
jgi:hypothetical protein